MHFYQITVSFDLTSYKKIAYGIGHRDIEIPPTLMASFLYLGAALGMSIVGFIKHKRYIEKTEARLTNFTFIR